VSSVRETLEALIDPLLNRPLVEAGRLESVEEKSRGRVAVSLAHQIPGHPSNMRVNGMVTAALADEARKVDVAERIMTDADREALIARLTEGVPELGGPGSQTRVIAITSGKGGVGKSSVSANLAVALTLAGKRVGLIDADVWGFSIPAMLGSHEPPAVIEERIIPPVAHGVKVMSMDYFVGEEKAVIWRGPMLHKALEQFLKDVLWDNPDYLLIDMPPGTGDVAISISQFMPRAQILVVTTPQPTAQRVAKRAALMAEQVNQEVMGVVENMSWFTGDDGKKYEIFGAGGGATLAEQLDVPLLAQVPLLPAMREGADTGKPVTIAAPDSEPAKVFEQLAAAVEERRPRVRTHPDLVIR